METQATPVGNPAHRELHRRAKHFDALVEALERYVDSDGYEDEIKEQGRAALDAARLSDVSENEG